MAEKMTLARPYAKAAFQYALSANILDDWSKMLKAAAIMAADKRVSKIVHDPSLTRAERAKFFTESKFFDQNFGNFIKVIAENDRFSLLTQISDLYEDLKLSHNAEANVVATSAFELDEKQQKSLESALAKKFNKKIKMKYKTNKDLIGGVVIQSGDIVIDGSVKGQLKKLLSALVA